MLLRFLPQIVLSFLSLRLLNVGSERIYGAVLSPQRAYQYPLPHMTSNDLTHMPLVLQMACEAGNDGAAYSTP